MCVLASLALPQTAWAQSRGVEPSLAFETQSPKPGSLIKVALVMDAKPGWHAYWTNPGEVGAPPRIEWKGPGDFIFSDLRQPAPKLMDVQGIESFVHEGSFALLTTMRVPSGLTAGEPIPLSAKVSWLACSSTQCVPESRTLEKVLVVGEGETDYPGLSRIRQAEARIPDGTVSGTFTYEDGRFVLSIPRSSGGSPSVFPSGQGWLEASASPIVRAMNDGTVISFAASPKMKKSGFSGVIRDGSDSYMVSARWVEPAPEVATSEVSPSIAETMEQGAGDDLSPQSADSEAPPEYVEAETENGEPSLSMLPVISVGSPTGASFGGVLIAAFLGGLLLNLMPCVFPILSLKALSLAKSSSGEKMARTEGVGYTLGTMGTVMAMGAFVILARDLGVSAGWSFQLQSPVFVLAMLALVSLITLNLAGGFEFAQFGRTSGMIAPGFRGSMGTGAMAALIASPCAGPFMAGALGAALVLPTISAMAVFAGLGLGMAFPFLLIALVPGLRQRLPRPGKWMGGLRRFLAVPMGLTAAWLAWILWRQADMMGLVAALLMVALVYVGTRLIGVRQKSGESARIPAMSMAALFVILIASFPVIASGKVERQGMETDGLVFSEQRLKSALSEGTPVLLDFTADWCLTCKVNEKVALDRDEVRRALDDAGIVVMTGDWTDGDPDITAFLERNGRNSIPFYVLYDGRGGARILPQVLTPSVLVEEAERLASSPR